MLPVCATTGAMGFPNVSPRIPGRVLRWGHPSTMGQTGLRWELVPAAPRLSLMLPIAVGTAGLLATNRIFFPLFWIGKVVLDQIY